MSESSGDAAPGDDRPYGAVATQLSEPFSPVKLGAKPFSRQNSPAQQRHPDGEQHSTRSVPSSLVQPQEESSGFEGWCASKDPAILILPSTKSGCRRTRDGGHMRRCLMRPRSALPNKDGSEDPYPSSGLRPSAAWPFLGSSKPESRPPGRSFIREGWVLRPWRGPLPRPRPKPVVMLADFMPSSLFSNPESVPKSSCDQAQPRRVPPAIQDLDATVEPVLNEHGHQWPEVGPTVQLIPSLNKKIRNRVNKGNQGADQRMALDRESVQFSAPSPSAISFSAADEDMVAKAMKRQAIKNLDGLPHNNSLDEQKQYSAMPSSAVPGFMCSSPMGSFMGYLPAFGFAGPCYGGFASIDSSGHGFLLPGAWVAI